MELQEFKEDYFAHEPEMKDLVVAGAKGSFIFDQEGKRYIDFTMGWSIGNIGWNPDEVVAAIKDFSGPSYVSPHFKYKPWQDLAEILADITPGKLEKSFRATGGTEAVEIALQAAIEHTGRKKFVGIEGAYHGNSIAAKGLVTKSSYFNWERINPPLNFEAADKLEDLLKSREVAAFIMEPVVCNLGVLIPDSGFMQRAQDLCRKYGTLLIMDEVACGFGRTGKFFATEHYNIEPDIMCLAKGITGGVAGLGAAVMTEEVGESLQKESMPYSSYGWHPLSVAAAIANIKYMQRNWKSLEESIRSTGEYLRQRLNEINFGSEMELNMIGLAISLGFSDADYGKSVSKRAFQEGLLLSDGISLFPALNIDFDTAKEGLSILEKCV